MAPRSLALCTGQRLQYELFLPSNYNPHVPIPFLVSVPGGGQAHVNGFSRRLPSDQWAVAVPLRPDGAPCFFQGRGARGDGPWLLHELCQHLLKEFAVKEGRFLMVGVSNGGNSVLRFATLWPRLCCGLVVVTGSLQGMVGLPEGLRALQGIPVDMYVGTQDEMGFYGPMVALAEHFKSVGHEPAAQLKIFRGAGHCCSPLIDDYLLHGKICLMLLRAGTSGSQVNLSIPKETRMTAGELLTALGAFSAALGLQCSSDGKNGLEVWAPGVQHSSIGSIGPPVPSVRDLSAPRLADFTDGDALEVWSNSQQRWVSATVVKVLAGGDEGRGRVTVNFKSEQGDMLSKTVPIASARQYLRRPVASGPAPPAAAGGPAGGLTPLRADASPVPTPGGAQRGATRRPTWSPDVQHSETPGRFGMPPADACAVPVARPERKKKTLMLPLAGAAGVDRSPVGGLAPSAACTGSGSLSPFGFRGRTAGCQVAVWSESQQKWFADGTVAEVTADALFVRFSADAMGKWVTAATSKKVLRLAEACPRQTASH